MKRKSLLLTRRGEGFGDWVLMMSLIKQINYQYPDIEVHIEFNGISPWFLQLLAYMDTYAVPVCNADCRAYDLCVANVIYDAPAEHNMFMLDSMINRFNRITGLSVRYDNIQDKLAKYIGPIPYTAAALPKKYIIMPSVGAETGRRNPDKEWGYDNFKELASLLYKSGFDIVQIGHSADPCISATITRSDCSLPELHALIIHSKALVSLENGLSHWSGHHKHKTFTIYRMIAPVRPCHARYENQVAITDEFASADTVHNTIVSALK